MGFGQRAQCLHPGWIPPPANLTLPQPLITAWTPPYSCIEVGGARPARCPRDSCNRERDVRPSGSLRGAAKRTLRLAGRPTGHIDEGPALRRWEINPSPIGSRSQKPTSGFSAGKTGVTRAASGCIWLYLHRTRRSHRTPRVGCGGVIRPAPSAALDGHEKVATQHGWLTRDRPTDSGASETRHQQTYAAGRWDTSRGTERVAHAPIYRRCLGYLAGICGARVSFDSLPPNGAR